MDRNVRLFAGALTGTALLLAGCGGGGDGGKARTAAAAPSPSGGGAAQLQQEYEQVVTSVLPSVVKIETDQGEGSGVVYDDKGDIVTNAHVVAGAKQIRVTASSGGSPLKANLVGSFVADDLAVVKATGGNLRPATFGDSTQAKVGQIVLAMGNPLGLAGSVTNGIVSALNRTVSTKQEGAFPGATIGDAIQTSAPINPGNSGGALVTLDGQVIGIPTAAASDPQIGGAAAGIGFAAPSATVKKIVPQLIQSGKVSQSGRAAIGAVVRTIVDPNSGQQSAVAVVEVTKGAGADKAGIKAGDLILSVNGTPTPDQTALASVLAGLKPGGTVKVRIEESNGSKKDVQVKLGELPGG
ncbi:S1C family serine protease [Actinomadura violacea]|uniref:Trypsin-like peptidase domain-containing protein n=1 Tax=Actinomadura violacea TaxID=2819934 RepID=A0ABS3S792_9ACTN|nr:trypsin-like peptidase domain-containing protein [Actinomadura violacea]MBO2464878.1 trypsin-like peptidase domain-containing protein [Actinomadura violacea]